MALFICCLAVRKTPEKNSDSSGFQSVGGFLVLRLNSDFGKKLINKFKLTFLICRRDRNISVWRQQGWRSQLLVNTRWTYHHRHSFLLSELWLNNLFLPLAQILLELFETLCLKFQKIRLDLSPSWAPNYIEDRLASLLKLKVIILRKKYHGTMVSFWFTFQAFRPVNNSLFSFNFNRWGIFYCRWVFSECFDFDRFAELTISRTWNSETIYRSFQ